MTTRNQTPKRPCTATRADGQPCRAWALHHSDPPLCAAHRDAQPTKQAHTQSPPSADDNLYAHHYSDKERAALRSLTHQRSLDSEVSLVRVALTRLLEDFDRRRGLTRPEMESRAAALYKGAHMVGKLWKLQVAIEKGGDGIHPVIAATLDEISEEWKIRL